MTEKVHLEISSRKSDPHPRKSVHFTKTFSIFSFQKTFDQNPLYDYS